MAEITVMLGQLMVSVENESNSPDALKDMTNRAKELITHAVTAISTNGLDLEDLLERTDLTEYEEDDDEEEEA